MVRHDNVHRIEWPLGLITAIYPDERGVIRTAEVEECGRRSLRPVSYLVPLELDCRHDDDELRQCLRDKRRNEEDDDNEDAVAFTANVDSFLGAEDQGGSNVSADAQGGVLPPDASYVEPTFHHRTSGSSRASGLATGTTTGCNTNATPTTVPASLPPYTVLTQPREGEERDAGWGEATTSKHPPRRAALKQKRTPRSPEKRRPALNPPAVRGR